MVSSWVLCYDAAAPTAATSEPPNAQPGASDWSSVITRTASDRFTESLLDEHEQELERVKRYYETNRVLIKDVNDHQNLWNKMIELDDKANDPAR